jgi:hypothetical protein
LLRIVHDPSRLSVLIAFDFDHEARLGAVELNNEVADGALAAELEAKLAGAG